MHARRGRPLEIHGFWARWCGLAACAVVLVGVLFAVTVAGARPAYRHCGEITVSPYTTPELATVEVAVPAGYAPCSEARRIIRKLYTGNERGRAYGEHHNPPRDMHESFWRIEGWKCQVGAGGGGCSRGPRNVITGLFVIEEEE